MRILAAAEKDIQAIQRKLEIHTEIQRIQWAITSALKTPDGDLDECSRNMDRFEKLLHELEANA